MPIPPSQLAARASQAAESSYNNRLAASAILGKAKQLNRTNASPRAFTSYQSELGKVNADGTLYKNIGDNLLATATSQSANGAFFSHTRP